MEGTTYGYVRVSTREQNEARQLAAMRKFGVEAGNVIVEKLSGKDFKRPLYQRLVRRLGPEDVLVVKSIDRLGRNYEEILEQWELITKARRIVLQLLSYVAQTERESIRQRQAEGIAEAKARGVRFGRKEMDIPEGFDDAAQMWLNGVISSREGARRVGMNHCTFIKYAKRKAEAR